MITLIWHCEICGQENKMKVLEDTPIAPLLYYCSNGCNNVSEKIVLVGKNENN